MTLKERLPKYISEAAGTFCLVFIGCGSIVANEISNGRITHLGICLAFGFVVMAMIYTTGHISGAHINPAVTLGFFATGRLKFSEVPPYIISQLIGSALGCFALKLIFSNRASNFGITQPTEGLMAGFTLEFFLTFILMFVIMGVATDHRAKGIMAGVAIGGTVAMAALMGGLISGASMNPARSFGPALVTGDFSHHWIYWSAPILGSLSGAWLYQRIKCLLPSSGDGPGCC